MYAKGLLGLLPFVIITAGPGCDNVTFGGFHMELRPPAMGAEAEVEQGEIPDPILESLDLGTVIYLVERQDGAAATALPIAALSGGEYESLPSPEEEPDLIERFAVDRWEEGTELALVAQGVRAGTFIAEGGLAENGSTCQLRPSGAGRIELHPDAGEEQWFLGIEKAALTDPFPATSFPGLSENAALRAASVDVAQRLMAQRGVPWPPSVPGSRRDLRPLPLDAEDRPALAASFVYDGDLVVGSAPSLAYSLFVIAESAGNRYEPLLSWYQRVDGGGKAFPRFLGSHDLRSRGSSDLLLEVYGEDSRWLMVLGRADAGWAVLYVDPCGIPPGPDAIRTVP